MQAPAAAVQGETGLSQAELAYRQIEERIVARTLPPGTLISEKQLGAELGCGRTPIREALQRLRLEGYVEILPSRGVMVARIDILAQLELLEVRRPMEGLLVRLAADRATEKQRATIRELIGRLSDAAAREDRSAFLTANRALQAELRAAASNRLLARMMEVIHGQSRRFWFTTLATRQNLQRAAEYHAATMRAVANGEAECAVAAAHAFLDFLEELTRDAIDRRLSL